MTVHGNLLVYGQTAAVTGPLVLCVGREPNVDQVVVNEVHTYDFDAPWGPRCKFWSESFHAAQQCADSSLAGTDLKAACRKANASPIVYADALPITIRMGSENPALKRRQASEMAGAHVRAIFSHSEVIERVEVIVLSGLLPQYGGRWFDAAVEEYGRLAESRILIHVPFFFPTNRVKIAQALAASGKAKEAIGDIVNSF